MSHAATNWAIRQRGLTPVTKIVLWHLADRHNSDLGCCYPKQARLAEDCEISRASLNRHLKTLERKGLIRRKSGRDGQTGRQMPTRYFLAFDRELDPQDVVCRVSNLDTEPRVSKSAHSVSHNFETLTGNRTSNTSPPPPEAGSPVRFQDVVALWPEEARGDIERAERAFDRVDPDEQVNVLAAAETYCAMMRKRLFSEGGREGQLTIRGFLGAGTYRDFVDAPPIGEGGRFVITPDRPEEWKAWMAWAVRRGPAAAHGLEAAQRLNTKTRWPQDMDGGRDA